MSLSLEKHVEKFADTPVRLGIGNSRPNLPKIFESKIKIKRLARLAIDVFVCAACFLVALLSVGSGYVLQEELGRVTLLFALVFGVTFYIVGTPARSWRFVSRPDVLILARDVTIAMIAFVVFVNFLGLQAAAPTFPVLLSYGLMLTLLLAVRVSYRGMSEARVHFGVTGGPNSRGSVTKSILVYGATAETDAFIRWVRAASGGEHEVVGIIDDDRTSGDRNVQGIKVLGRSADLNSIIADFEEKSIEVANLVVPTSDLPRAKIRAIVDAAHAARLPTVRLPDTSKLLKDDGAGVTFEPINVADLLGRPPVKLKLDSIDNLIRGKSIVVTGGGGSIGSELCRQLLQHRPARLVVIDHSEFNLYNIERELSAVDGNGVVQPILASIRDRAQILSIFRQVNPHLVFHAAAYKHVPLVETNPIEGILTNVVGTANVADAVAAVGGAAMIMISTDKAVKPHCVMGLSKRIAETYCRAMDAHCASIKSPTRFMVVRFGNVLGSSGSVVPVFERQIRSGGPVTVTDPKMTRYFMTIPEAVSLVLQGSTFSMENRGSTNGVVMVLDMGEPVLILELARRMISLAGFVPDDDIPISFIGIRDGEKLHEELFDTNEIKETTDVAGIQLARSEIRDIKKMRALRDFLAAEASGHEASAIIQILYDVLSEQDEVLFAEDVERRNAKRDNRGEGKSSKRGKRAKQLAAASEAQRIVQEQFC